MIHMLSLYEEAGIDEQDLRELRPRLEATELTLPHEGPKASCLLTDESGHPQELSGSSSSG